MAAPNNVESDLNKVMFYTLLFIFGSILWMSLLVHIELTYFPQLPWAQFLFYLSMHPIGFVFVNVVTLQNERRSWLISGNDVYLDIIVVVIVAVLQYAMAGYVVLKDPYFGATTMCDYVFLDADLTCANPSFYDTLTYNSLFWIVPYYAGLLFTHLDSGIMSNISFT